MDKIWQLLGWSHPTETTYLLTAPESPPPTPPLEPESVLVSIPEPIFPEPEPEPDPEPDPEPPANTEHTGTTYLYYAADNEAAFNSISNIDDHLGFDAIVAEAVPRGISGFFRFLCTKEERLDRTLNMMKVMSPTTYWVPMMRNIEQLRSTQDDIYFGEQNEYEDNLDLNTAVIRSRNKNVQCKLYRSLFVAQWTFALNLPENWRDNIQISISDITKNKGKKALYTLAMIRYRELIEQAIEFRKKHYKFLQESVTHNIFNEEFYQDLGVLFDSLIEYSRMYNDFNETLSSCQRKKMQRKIQSNAATTPTVNLKFNFRTKHIDNYQNDHFQLRWH